MFDLMKTLNSGKPGKLDSQMTSKELLGKNKKGNAELEALSSEFENLLKQNTQAPTEKSDLMSMLTNDTKSSLANKSEARIAQSGQEDLLNLLNSDEDPATKISQLSEMIESGDLTIAELESADLTSVDPSIIDSIVNDKAANPSDVVLKDDSLLNASRSKTSGPLNLGLNKESTIEEKNFFKTADQNISKDSLSVDNTKFDHRLQSQLKQPGLKSESKLNVNYSEDFISQKNVNQLNQKPQVISQKHAFNMFQKEKSVLDEGGIIKKNIETNFGVDNSRFDSFAKESLTTSTDDLNIVENQVIDINSIANKNDKAAMVGTMSISSVGTDSQVIDLSNVNSKEQLISEITNYIENSKIQNGKEFEIIVNHNDLGQFKVNAQKAANGEMIDIKISTATAEGNNFFNQNDVNLLKSLNASGVKVSDIKVVMNEANAQSSRNDSAGQNNSGNSQGFARNYNGGSDFHDQGKQKRQELWENYRQQMGA